MGLFGWARSPEDRFAQDVLEAVQATGLVSAARYDRDEFAIVYRLPGDDSEKGRIYLHNTFRETSGSSAEERTERVHRLVAAVVGSQARRETWEAARPRLRPVLRGVSFGAGMIDPSMALVSRPALPYLLELVVVDEPTSMAYVTKVQLAEWGVRAEDVFAAARENLTAMIAPWPGGEGEPSGTIMRFLDDGESYVTSRLLLDGFLASLADRVGGRPIAFVPDRDTLMVAPAELDGVAMLYQMVEDQYSAATRAVSPVGYTSDDGGRVVPYLAPPGTDLAGTVHRAEVLLAAAEYRAQKEALDTAHERDGVDIFVGSLLVMERPDQALASVAVWSMDVDTLMPQADLVAFQPDDSSDSPTLLVPFDIVTREAVLVAEPDFDPPRYRVTTWPDAPVMARLRQHAVDLS